MRKGEQQAAPGAHPWQISWFTWTARRIKSGGRYEYDTQDATLTSAAAAYPGSWYLRFSGPPREIQTTKTIDTAD